MIIDEAIQYCNDVLNDKIIACNTVKQACRRFLNDLNREDLLFDSKPVELFNKFCTCFHHYTGQYNGLVFVLTDWQKFFVANLLGLKYKATNARKYQKVYFSLARKQGKSSLVAILSLFLLMLDNEPAAEIIIVANSVAQANTNLTITQKFGKQLDKKHKHLIPQYSRIKYKDNILQIKANDHKNLDSFNSSCVIIDEMAYSNKQTYDTLLSGQVSRKEPIMIQIGTTGNDLTKYMYEQYLLYKKMLNSELPFDDRLLLIIYELDDEDLINDEWQKDLTLLKKSNPNLNISVTEEFLYQQIQTTILDSSNRSSVLIKHFNRWIDNTVLNNNEEKYIDDAIVLNNMQDIDLSDYKGCWAFAAVDLSSTQDLNTLTILIVKDGLYYFKNFFYLPEQNNNIKDVKSKLAVWNKEGYINLTAGNCLDSNAIVKDIKKIIDDGIDIIELHLDVYNSTSFQLEAAKEIPSLPVIPYRQSFLNFNAPTKELKMLMLREQCRIDKNAITRWNFHNAVVHETNQGNQKCMKEGNNKANKIDSVIGMQMALGGLLSSNYCYQSN